MEREKRKKTDPQEFDNTLKSLFGKEAPQIMPRLLPGAEIIESTNIELVRTTLRADLVYKAIYKETMHIIQMEMQTRGIIDLRMMQYHAGFHAKHKLPVISVGLYPFKTKVPQPPYIEMSADGPEMIFNYRNICLWEIDAQQFVEQHAVYLYTLLPAMKGANVSLLKQALQEMKRHYTRHQFGHHLARFERFMRRSSTLTRKQKHEIYEELSMHYKYDWFIDDNPHVRKRVRVAKEKALEEGKQVGLLEGKQVGLIEAARSLQSSISNILKLRFPELAQEVQPALEKITTLEQLNHMLVKLFMITSEAEVRALFIPAGDQGPAKTRQSTD